MNKVTHFMYVPFTGLGLHGGYRGDIWLRSRIKIFKEYVIPSLMVQSNQDFIIWISWRPEEENNPIVLDLYESMSNLRGLKVIFTFHGVCFWDDKYDDSQARRRLRENLEFSLPELKEAVGDSKTVLMTIQPSDDMYLSDYVEDCQRSFKTIGWKVLLARKGYMIDYASKEISEYNPTTNPPFYTISFPSDVFLNEYKHMEYTGPYKSHEHVVDFNPRDFLSERGFIVGTHGENISTTYNHPYRGAVLSLEEQENVLINAGVWMSDPIKGRMGSRLVARKILNRLPFQNIIRDFYYILPKCLQLF